MSTFPPSDGLKKRLGSVILTVHKITIICSVKANIVKEMNNVNPDMRR